MSMGNMRLITSSSNPQDVMDFATKACRNDFYEGASFLSKAGNEYRFKCVKAEENEILIPIPGTTIAPVAKAEAK
jgi:DNA relaxase NicK